MFVAWHCWGIYISAPQDEGKNIATMIEQGVWGVHNFSSAPIAFLL